MAIIVEQRHLGDRALVEARSTLEFAGCHVPLVVPDANHAFDIPSEAPPERSLMSPRSPRAGDAALPQPDEGVLLAAPRTQRPCLGRDVDRGQRLHGPRPLPYPGHKVRGLEYSAGGVIYSLSAAVFLLAGPFYGWITGRYGRLVGLPRARPPTLDRL